MIKILALGNSFSQNATTYLDRIVDDVYVRNLYIGGCPLVKHNYNLDNNIATYELQVQGERVGDLVSANDIIKSEKWDYITVQQASPYSGVYESYYPYITNVLNYIKTLCPTAKIVFHQTWAYATYFNSEFFDTYKRDQKYMFDCIVKASNKVAEENNLPIIKVGPAIQKLRDVNPDGKEYSCDGLHLNSMGCFIAGIIWGEFFGKHWNGFIPEGLDKKEIEKNLKILGLLK